MLTGTPPVTVHWEMVQAPDPTTLLLVRVVLERVAPVTVLLVRVVAERDEPLTVLEVQVLASLTCEPALICESVRVEASQVESALTKL